MRTLGPPATVAVAALGGLLAAWRPAVGLAALAAVALGAALWSAVAASRLRPVDLAVATPLLLLPLTPYLAREVDPSLTYLRFALALAVVAGLATGLIPAREGWLRGIGLVIVALALAQVIPAATAPSSGYGALRWVNWIAFVPYAFIRYDRRSLGVALVAALGGAALLAAGMLAQQRGVLGGAWGGIQLGVGALQPTFQRRYTSFLLEPNHLALFMLSVGIVLYVYAVVAAPGRRRLLAALLGVAICAYCVYVTRSRGALLAIPFVGAFFLVARAMRVFAVTAAIALVAAIVVLPVSPAARGAVDSTWDGVTRILKGEDTSAVLRLTNWRERVDQSGSPVLGTGFGGYAAVHADRPERSREPARDRHVAHRRQRVAEALAGGGRPRGAGAGGDLRGRPSRVAAGGAHPGSDGDRPGARRAALRRHLPRLQRGPVRHQPVELPDLDRDRHGAVAPGARARARPRPGGRMTELPLDANKRGEIENAERSLAALTAPASAHRTKPFGIQWPAVWWLKWATIHHAFRTLGVPFGASVLDVGAGTGWASLLLAEAGYKVTGVDIAPGNVRIAELHAERWGSEATFEVADMDSLDLGRAFDAVLVFDALHHVDQPAAVVPRIARHLAPGGWVLFGEPSLLHYISPSAHAVTRRKAWIERGVRVRALRRWCRDAGLTRTRRFFEPTRPYERRGTEFGWELLRLVAANVLFAPSYNVWLAAQRPPAAQASARSRA